MADKIFYWIGQMGITANANTYAPAQTPTDPYFLSTANYWNNKSNWAQKDSNYGGPLGGQGGGGTTDGTTQFAGLQLKTATRFPVQGDSVYFRGMTASVDGGTAQKYPLTECLYGGISGDGNWEGGTSDGGITTGHGLTGMLHKLVIDDSYNINLLYRTRDGGVSGGGTNQWGVAEGEPSTQAGCQGWGSHRFGVIMTDQAGGTNANFKVGGWQGLGIAAETYISNRTVKLRAGRPGYGACSMAGSASSRSRDGMGKFAYATYLSGKVNINELYINANDDFIFNQETYGAGCTIGKVYMQRMVGLTADWPASSSCSGTNPELIGHKENQAYSDCSTFEVQMDAIYDGWNSAKSPNRPVFKMYGPSDKYQITTLYRDTGRNTYADLIQSSTPIPNVVLASQCRQSFYSEMEDSWSLEKPAVEIYADVENLSIFPQTAFTGIGGSAGWYGIEYNYMGGSFVCLHGKWNAGTQAGVSAGIITLQDYNPYYNISGYGGITQDSLIEGEFTSENWPGNMQKAYNLGLKLDASAGGTVVNLKVESGFFVPWSGDSAEDTTLCTVMDGEVHGRGTMMCHDPLTDWPGFEVSGYTTGQDAPHGYGMLIVDTDATLHFQAGQKVAVHGSSAGIQSVLTPTFTTTSAGGKG
tara:strand:+ start:260 stop:2182 length:1923 start_codon:yes stop_codon:yes gene_type:complete